MKIIQRGYPGHFISASKCLFRIHTDIVMDNDTVVCISSVGDYIVDNKAWSLDAFENKFETYVFSKKDMDDSDISNVLEVHKFTDNLACELKHNELIEKYSIGGI